MTKRSNHHAVLLSLIRRDPSYIVHHPFCLIRLRRSQPTENSTWLRTGPL